MRPEKKQHKLNDEIEAKNIRLINAEGVMVGLVSLREALEDARQSELDLVEVTIKPDESICKVMDYGKHLYQQKKNKKNNANKPKPEKEIKLRPVTGEADIQRHINHIKEFVTDGHNVKVSVLFKNRELNMKPRGEKIMLSIISEISEKAKIKKPLAFTGRAWVVLVEPS